MCTAPVTVPGMLSELKKMFVRKEEQKNREALKATVLRWQKKYLRLKFLKWKEVIYIPLFDDMKFLPVRISSHSC